ncbi:DUF6339 family protein [Tsuneonella sp. HG249]
MTGVSLFPRLDPLAVEQCLTRIDELIADSSRPLIDDRLPVGTGWTAIGGAQIALMVLGELRTLLVEAARSCGFPERGSVSDRARFDALVTAKLADFPQLESGEADRDDVWAFLTTVLAPDVVAWRFVNRSPDRFMGGVRNAFQRLWMRAHALDRGAEAGEDRWHLVEQLTEDALVQITERPSVGADQRLSRAIAEAWIRTAASIGATRMEEVMRKAIIDLRIRNEIQMLSALADELLLAHVEQIFARAAGLEQGDDAPPTPISLTKIEIPESSPRGPASLSIGTGIGSETVSKTGELVIQHAILELMLDGEEWSNGKLKARLAHLLPLTDADRGVGARPAEELWENRVNNALGRARASSLYAKGLVESCGHGLHRITAIGRAHVLEDADLDRIQEMPGGEAEADRPATGA